MAIKAAVALTYEDLQHFPDDGYRRELVHGQLIVSAAPVHNHQRAVSRLIVALAAACPPNLEVLPAPCDWAVSEDTVYEPDIIVVGRDAPWDRRFEGTPQLAVEVLSPSTKDTDTVLKRYEYEQAGVPAYWIVDVDVPSLTVLSLDAGSYTEAARVEGSESYDAEWPYQVTITPLDLVS
ncbi:MAG: Uma2 family endonuclease [Acidimicrobiales bacterium]